MHRNAEFFQKVRNLVITLLLGAAASSMGATEINVTRTNLVDRWITNLIEVRMPANHFVNEYHTNWITQMRTNIVDIYATNLVTRTLTNRIVVDTFQTNFVSDYHTNSQTINLTNWQTVVVIKTNWTVQPVTTVVEVAKTSNPPAVTESRSTGENVEPRPAIVQPVAPSAASLTVDGLVLEATRASRATANGQIEVTLKARSASNPGTPLQIQQWRVEREDGAILVFGQDPEFKRELPIGRYKLEVKIQHDAETPLVTARAILAVTAQEALLQQRLTARR